MQLVAVQRAVFKRVGVVADLGQVPPGELVGVGDDVGAARQVIEVGLERGRVHGDQHVGGVARGEDVVVGEVKLEAHTPGSVPAGARISAGKFGSVERSFPKLAVSCVNLSPASCIPSPESPANLMITWSSCCTCLVTAEFLLCAPKPRSGCGDGVSA